MGEEGKGHESKISQGGDRLQEGTNVHKEGGERSKQPKHGGEKREKGGDWHSIGGEAFTGLESGKKNRKEKESFAQSKNQWLQFWEGKKPGGQNYSRGPIGRPDVSRTRLKTTKKTEEGGKERERGDVRTPS